MQSQDLLPHQTSNASTQQLQATLQDITTKVQIQSNFCIHHPDYKPLELPSVALERLQQLPTNLQNKFQKELLCTFLYGIYYNGALRAALALNADAPAQTLVQNLENNTFLGVDLAFYEQLHSCNTGEGYFDPGWLVLREEIDGSLAVKKGELTLHIERARHLQPAQTSATVSSEVAIRMPRNLVQNGFYMAVGNAGRRSSANLDSHGELVRVYFNLSAEGAVAVMGSVTQQLNAIEIPFSFKALYNPSDYGRYDCAVLYFEKHNYSSVRQVLQSLYTEHKLHFRAQVPLFTKMLAPGLALAEEPDRKFTEAESFGLNRCHIVANGLLTAWRQGDESKEGRMAAILQQFALLGIEWQRPYLNANSQDIYEFG